MNANRPPAVPLCDLPNQYRELQADIEKAVSQVMASGQVILGPEVTSLEKEVADYCGCAYAIGCASGTDAILLALHAMKIGPGDEVILPPFTFFATAGSVVRTGATPVFVDIEPETFNIDVSRIERYITGRTKAIMPVHLYGQCCDMAELWKIGEKYGIPIIEDAAQSFGADYEGKRCGTLGAMACMSFYPTKNLGTYGDAGMTLTNDAEWAERMSTLRVHGMKPKYYHQMLGWNARIDAVQAAILRVKLPHVDRWIQQRREAAKRYDQMIFDAGIENDLVRPIRRPDRNHTFNQYVIRIKSTDRDSVVDQFKANNIGYEIYYPRPLHLQECLSGLGYRMGDFPVSEAASREVLALPMFPEITAEQQSRVISVLSGAVRKPMRKAA